MTKRPKATRLQAQCQALSNAIRAGAVAQANIQGTTRKLIGIKSEPGGIVLLFHDEEGALCMLRNVQAPAIELIVRIESEARP